MLSVTRACSLLIIISNPHVFANDPHWVKLVKLCIEEGAYDGVPIRQDLEHDELRALQKKLEDMLDPKDASLDGNQATHEMRQGAMPMPDFDA